MSRLPTFTQEIDLPTLIDKFSDDARCRAYLERLRWPDGARCLRCGSDNLLPIVARGQYDCRGCGYQFSVTVGTIFADSHLPLRKWFLAIYIIGESKKGVSSNQLKRMLGVSYKTAWYLTHRIRKAMADMLADQLRGIVEADETWIGHSARYHGPHSRPAATPLTTVMGVVEREGRVRVRISEHRQVTKADVTAFLGAVVADEATAIYTDGAHVYADLGDEDTIHGAVNHAIGEWVQGDVHTNTIESVWSLFKRSIIGSYHHLSVKHLAAYLDEMAFRYNERENAYLFRDTILRLIDAAPLRYAELVAS